MAITHTNSAPHNVRNLLADTVVDLIDAGAGAGNLKIYTTAKGTLLATLAFSDPAFGAASGGVATANSISDETNATAGTAAEFYVEDSDTNEIFQGTVTVTSGGGDMELSSVALANGDRVSITSMTYTAPV